VFDFWWPVIKRRWSKRKEAEKLNQTPTTALPTLTKMKLAKNTKTSKAKTKAAEPIVVAESDSFLNLTPPSSVTCFQVTLVASILGALSTTITKIYALTIKHHLDLFGTWSSSNYE